MSVLERSIQFPMTADGFMARIEEVVRLTGVSTDEASQSLIASLGARDLERLLEELLEQEFGDDIAAREEFRRVAEKQAAADSVTSNFRAAAESRQGCEATDNRY